MIFGDLNLGIDEFFVGMTGHKPCGSFYDTI